MPDYGERRMINRRIWILLVTIALTALRVVAWEEPATRINVYGGEDYKVFLGSTTLPEKDPDSIWNEWGKYGSKDSPLSMFNPNGMYGSPVSPYSPWNPFASNPPALYTEEGYFTGFLYGEDGKLKERKSLDDPREREKKPSRPLLPPEEASTSGSDSAEDEDKADAEE